MLIWNRCHVTQQTARDYITKCPFHFVCSITMMRSAVFTAALVALPRWHLASALSVDFRPPNSGHIMSGVPLRAAGVVPYVNLPGRGIHFLLQNMQNGSRVGKLCDFGGRREASDADVFATAARELCEETDFAFGDVEDVADSLRNDAQVRIVNRGGKYVTFFLKVSYCNAAMLPTVDTTADHEPVERECRWWRADELLSRVDDSQLLERMLPELIGYPDAASAAGGGSADGEADDEPKPLSSFKKAVCKTLSVENAHPMAHERWHSTVLSTLAAAEKRREEERRAALALDLALASVASVQVYGGASNRRKGAAGSKPPSRPTSYSPGRSGGGKPNGLVKPNGGGEKGTGRSEKSSRSASSGGGLAPKRGSRRGPDRSARSKPPAWTRTKERVAAERHAASEKRARARVVKRDRYAAQQRDDEWELPWPSLDGFGI